MSIVTISEFLSAGRESNSKSDESSGTSYLDVASLTLAAARRLVLGGETFADLSAEMGTIREDLHVENGEIARQCAARVEEVFARYRDRVRQAEMDRASDFSSVLEMLNEALTYLSANGAKTDASGKQLESSLQQATRMDDRIALKKHLSNVLATVREERRDQTEKTQAVIQSLGAQVQKAHKAQLRFLSHLPTRTDALESLKQISNGGAPKGLQVGLFVADSLPLIRERHGEEVAGLILQDLGRKQIQPLVPGSQIYEWSANALLLVWCETEKSISASDLLAGLRTSYQQRAFVGGRVAVFNVVLRSLAVQARDSMEEWVSTLDRFCKRGS